MKQPRAQLAYQFPARSESSRLLSISMSFMASLSISADMKRHCAVPCSSSADSLAFFSVMSTSSRVLKTVHKLTTTDILPRVWLNYHNKPQQTTTRLQQTTMDHELITIRPQWTNRRWCKRWMDDGKNAKSNWWRCRWRWSQMKRADNGKRTAKTMAKTEK